MDIYKLKLGLFFALIYFSSCSPMSKESYIAEYKEFITEIKENSKTYDDAAWAEADERFQMYSEEYYAKFENDLTMKEELTLASYALQYGTLRTTQAMRDLAGFIFDEEDGLLTFLRDEYSDDVEAFMSDLVDEFTYYKENQMEEDLEKLKKAIDEASNSLPELKVLLKELDADSLNW